MIELLLGCMASSDEASSAEGASDTGYTGENSEDTGDQDSDEDTASSPVWWTLTATVPVEAGEAVKGGVITTRFLDEGGEVLCEDAHPITAISEEDSPYEDVYAWWSISVEASSKGCDASPLPVPLLLGVGAMHPEIAAGLDTVDAVSSGSSASLNSAYASLDGLESLLVFGVAGTAAAYKGEGVAADAAPLADGEWRIEPVYSFRYDL